MFGILVLSSIAEVMVVVVDVLALVLADASLSFPLI